MKHFSTQLFKYASISLSTILLCLLLLGVNAYASNQEDSKEDVQKAASAIKDHSIEQKDATVAKAKELMDKLDSNIDSWESTIKGKWHGLEESSKKNYELSKKDFNKQREELAVWLDKLEKSSADAWDETKQGFVEAHDSLIESWHNANKEVSKEN